MGSESRSRGNSQKIEPPQDITKSMSKQMKDEREKRANILDAEGIKAGCDLKSGRRQGSRRACG